MEYFLAFLWLFAGGVSYGLFWVTDNLPEDEEVCLAVVGLCILACPFALAVALVLAFAPWFETEKKEKP